jgi:hypothetical protein
VETRIEVIGERTAGGFSDLNMPLAKITHRQLSDSGHPSGFRQGGEPAKIVLGLGHCSPNGVSVERI